jgi:calcium permeable stress-gated cation channel
VLAILVVSGIVLLPLLLPLAATDHALENSAGFKNGKAAQNFTIIERLALGNVQVSNFLLQLPFRSVFVAIN